MVCGVVLWLCAGTHQPPPSPSTPRVRRDGWTACEVVWWLQAHMHQPPSRVVGGAVVERRALTHQPPSFLLLSSPVLRVGWSPRGGERTAREVVCWLFAHTHQPPPTVLGGALV